MATLVQPIRQFSLEAARQLDGQAVLLPQRAEELIHSLGGRIRGLETELSRSEERRITEWGREHQRLIQVCLDKDQLTLELAAAREELARLNAVEAELRVVQGKSDQDQQRMAHLQEQVNAGRNEIGLLTEQVGQGRQQVQRLAAQLQHAIDRGDALEGQVRRMADLMQQQQELIRQQQRESAEAKRCAEEDEYLNRTGLDQLFDGLIQAPKAFDDLLRRIFG